MSYFTRKKYQLKLQILSLPQSPSFDLFTEGVCEQRAGGQGLRFVTKILQLPRDVPATVTPPYSLRHCWIQPAHHPVPGRDSNSVWCCSDHCQRGGSQWYDSFI